MKTAHSNEDALAPPATNAGDEGGSEERILKQTCDRHPQRVARKSKGNNCPWKPKNERKWRPSIPTQCLRVADAHRERCHDGEYKNLF
jgi:hypothetical protein